MAFSRPIYPRPRQEIEEELLLRGSMGREVMHTTRGRTGRSPWRARRALRRDRVWEADRDPEIKTAIITEQKRKSRSTFRQSQKMEAVGTLAAASPHDFKQYSWQPSSVFYGNVLLTKLTQVASLSATCSAS